MDILMCSGEAQKIVRKMTEEAMEKASSVAEDLPEKQGKRAGSWRWMVAVVVSMAIFLDTVDVSIINVAMPNMQRDLQLTTTELQWVPGAYVLTNAGLQLLGGRAADLLGRRRNLSDRHCTLRTVFSDRGAGAERVAVGSGARSAGHRSGNMFPSAVSIITTTFTEGPERSKALGIFSAVAGIGFSLGLVLGGLLTSFISWHWVFFVNVPIAVLIVTLTLLLVPEGYAPRDTRSYDLAGALTVTAGLLLLVYTITQANDSEATPAKTAGLFLLAFGLLVVFIFIERGSRAPLMPLRIFQTSTIRAANGAFLLLLGSFFGYLLAFTLSLQEVLHYSPLYASLALLPGSVASALTSWFIVPRLLKRVGMKLTCVLGLVCLMSGIMLFTRIEADSTYVWVILPAVLLAQVGMGIGHPALSLAGVSGIEPTEQGLAAGLQGSMGAAGAGLGLAVVSAVVAAMMTPALHTATGSATAAQLSGLHAGLMVAAGGAALGALIAFVGLRNRAETSLKE